MFRVFRSATTLIVGGLLVGAIVGQASAGQPTFTWHDASDNEDGFRVYRLAVDPLPQAKVCEVAANVQTCQGSEDIQLGYCYVAKAFNTAGESDPSPQACWKVPTAPGTLIIVIP